MYVYTSKKKPIHTKRFATGQNFNNLNEFRALTILLSSLSMRTCVRACVRWFVHDCELVCVKRERLFYSYPTESLTFIELESWYAVGYKIFICDLDRDN